MTIRFLQSICSGTCVRYAQSRTWLGVTLSLCTLLAHGLTLTVQNLAHKEDSTLLLRQRSAALGI